MSYPNLRSSALEDEAEEDNDMLLPKTTKEDPSKTTKVRIVRIISKGKPTKTTASLVETPKDKITDHNSLEIGYNVVVDSLGRNRSISSETVKKGCFGRRPQKVLPEIANNIFPPKELDLEKEVEMKINRAQSPEGIKNDDRSIGRCETCDLTFHTKRERSEHLRTVHGVEKPFQCELCGARFPYSSSLYNHTRIHSNNKPFKCTSCDASFRWKNSLLHHRLFIHKEEPEKVHIAAKCVLEGKKLPFSAEISSPESEVDEERPVRVSKRHKMNASNSDTIAATVDSVVSSVLSQPLVLFMPSLFIPSEALPDDQSSPEPDSDVVPMPTALDELPVESGTKRRRKPVVQRIERNHAFSNVDTDKIHTCGHCEEKFSHWTDLVSHIQECANKEEHSDYRPIRLGNADAEGDTQDNEHMDESDSDSDAPCGLVIDQFGVDGNEDEQEEPETSVKSSLNFNFALAGIQRCKEALNDYGTTYSTSDSFGRASRTYGRVTSRIQEGRNSVLESTVSRLKSQLVNKN